MAEMVNLSKMLNDAKDNKYALGSFNVYSFETIRGVIACANELGTPAIVAFGAKYLENMDMEEVVACVKHETAKGNQPIALHLDHCPKKEIIKEAIDKGFTSVMYDGSALPFEENVKNTKEVVEYAHAHGVSVEAELGSLAAGAESHEGSESDIEKYTNPEQAKEFVERTGVDCLAVSIGTVHGMYKGTPNVRVDVLQNIKKAVDIPFVLHGGSGTPEETIKECIKNGICKINVNTEISSYAVDNVKKLLNESEKKPHLSVLSLHIIDYVKEIVAKYTKFFR